MTENSGETAAFAPTRRLDFEGLVPAFSRAVSALDAAAAEELDRTAVDAGLRELVRLRASQLNGCSYCVDTHTRAAQDAGEPPQRIAAVTVWAESNFFTVAERAAFALTDAVTRLSETHVPDEVVAEARAQYSDEQVAALLALLVSINAWNEIGVTARCWRPRLGG